MGKRIRSRRRGRGSIYRAPSHRYIADVKYPRGKTLKGIVKNLIHDSGRTAPLAEIDFNSELVYLPATQELKVNDTISVGGEVQTVTGNITTLEYIPIGSKICNIERRPGDGGKLVRAAGTFATVVSKDEENIVVQLPSGKLMEFNPRCRATIGVVAGGGRKDKPFMKAGNKFHAVKRKARIYPIVSSVKMNPVDHPHGGGGHQHVGKPKSVSRGMPPGKKVGQIAPRKSGYRK